MNELEQRLAIELKQSLKGLTKAQVIARYGYLKLAGGFDGKPIQNILFKKLIKNLEFIQDNEIVFKEE